MIEIMRAPAEDKKVDLKELVEAALDAEDLTPLVCSRTDSMMVARQVVSCP